MNSTSWKYELNFSNDELYDSQELSNDELTKQLMFPFSKEEPNLTPEELQCLDAIADIIEVKRLKSMQVLTDTTEMLAHHKVLSTRFVRTWREKLSDTGEPIWLRVSRLVAREFAWMDSERDSLFSPASNTIVARLLPTMFLEMKENSDCVMVSIGVKDAFLTVKQQTAMVVNCTLADGEVQPYGLGRVLPGQRDGSLLWHRVMKNLQPQTGPGRNIFFSFFYRFGHHFIYHFLFHLSFHSFFFYHFIFHFFIILFFIFLSFFIILFFIFLSFFFIIF